MVQDLAEWVWTDASGLPDGAAQACTAAQCERFLEEWPGRGVLAIAFRADRLDEALDPIIEGRMRSATTAAMQAAYRVLLGKVGVCAAKAAYHRVRRAVNGQRFAALRPRFFCVAKSGRIPENPDEGLADARLILDKLANYQIDLDAVLVRI